MLKPNLAIIRMRSAVVMMPLAAALQSSAAQFTAEGHGEARLFQEGGLRETQSATFSVTVNETNWFIKVSQTGSSAPAKDAVWLEYRTFAAASNILTLGYFDQDTLDRTRRSFPNHSMHGMAWVERSTVPRGDSSIWISPLWYALCSSAYLSGRSHGLIEPCYNVDGDIEYYQMGITNVPARWLISQGDLRLPSQVVFLHSGKRLDKWGNRITFPAPFDAGFTNATLFTEFMDEHQDGKRPRDIFFRVAYPEPTSDGRVSLIIFLEVDLHVESFTHSRVEFAAQTLVDGDFAFTDRRFMNPAFDVARINYVTNRLLTDEEVMALPQFAMRKKQHLAAGARSGVTRMHRLAWIGIVTLITLGFAWIVWRVKTKKQTKT